MIEFLKIFGLLWALSFGGMYYLSWRTGNKAVLPGDIYWKKAGREVYVPLGSSIGLAIILYIILSGFR